MFERVLLVLNDRKGAAVLLNAASAVTDAERAWLTLMATPVAPPAWAYGVSLLNPPMPTKEELHRAGASLLDEVAASADRACRLATVVRTDELERAIASRVSAANHDLVVVAADALRRSNWPLTSRGTAAFVRKTEVPFLIVPTA